VHDHCAPVGIEDLRVDEAVGADSPR